MKIYNTLFAGTLLLIAISVPGCGGGGGAGPADSSVTPTAPVAPTGGDEYGSGPDPVPTPTGNPTSNKLIDTALAAGTITEEQALIYKVYAEFGDPALPAQYLGDNTGLIEGDAQQQIVSYVDRIGAANVPAATLDVLYSFLVPAYYEGSWWHKQHPAARSVVARAVSPNCRPWVPGEICSVLTDWKKLEGLHVAVWYETANESVDMASAQILLQELETKIWPSLTTLMGRTPVSDLGSGLITSETDGRLDVMLVDMPGNSQGRTSPSASKCKATPTHIYLSRTLPIRGLLAQAAHEFMHAIQYSYDSKSCVNDYYTTLEATAVWATNYVYPKNNWEHTYANSYLKGSYVGVAYDDRTAPPLFRYGAYVLPLFLQTRFDALIVKDIWDQTLVYSQELYAINGALVGRGSTFEKEWPKFVASNWNRDTLDTYVKFDSLTVAADMEADTVFAVPAGGGGTEQQAAALPHASSAYYRVKINDPATRSLTFVNGWSFMADAQDLSGGFGPTLTYTGLGLLERQGASMQIFLKINGVWQSAPHNLKNVPWFTACRDDPAGKIEEIVFMYANAEISPSAPNYTELTSRGALNPGLFATNIGCRNWTGSLSLTRPLEGGQETIAISNIVMKNEMATAVPAPGGEPASYPIPVGETISPGYGYVYSIVSGNAAWNYSNYTGDAINHCTDTGSKSFSIANPMPTHTFSHWTPPGGAARGAFLTGFVGMNALFLSYDWRCVNSGTVSTGSDITNGSNDITTSIDDAAVRFSANGLSISGTGVQTGDPDVTGTWSLQGATN